MPRYVVFSYITLRYVALYATAFYFLPLVNIDMHPFDRIYYTGRMSDIYKAYNFHRLFERMLCFSILN